MEQFKKAISLILEDDEGKELTIKFIASKAGPLVNLKVEDMKEITNIAAYFKCK